jgi:hypothetical protein
MDQRHPKALCKQGAAACRKASGELPDQVVRPISSPSLIGLLLECKGEYHKRSDKDPTDAALSHSRAKGPAQHNGHVSIQTILLAKPGQYGLGSTETLAKEPFCFLSPTHVEIPPWVEYDPRKVSPAETAALKRIRGFVAAVDRAHLNRARNNTPNAPLVLQLSNDSAA